MILSDDAHRHPSRTAHRFEFDPLVLIILSLSVLVCAPWLPGFPQPGLDSSWVYATSRAVSAGLRFGHDIVWTYGPLSEIFTSTYDPVGLPVAIAAGSVLGAAITTGFAGLAKRRANVLLFIVPVVLARELPLDGVVAGFALVFLLTVVQRRDDWLHAANLTLMAAALGILPLIKCSYIIPTGLALMFGVVATVRRTPRICVTLSVAALVGLITPWLAIGQRMSDLPGYLAAGPLLMAGYSAMAITGPRAPMVLYLCCVAVLMVFALFGLRARGLVIAGFALLAFFVFKASFVRHDGHFVLGATFLLLVGLAFGLASRSWLGALPLVVGLVGGLTMDHMAGARGPLGMVQRMTLITTRSLDGVHLTSQFPAMYAAAKDAIVKAEPLPDTKGTVDLYTTALSALLATDRPWNPRPVFQSYQAYSPVLARWNADHLTGPSAPDTVLFRPDTVDNRYPAFEDALSWPALVSHYRFDRLDRNFDVLSRRETPQPDPRSETLGRVTAALGQDVPVPEGRVWAAIDVSPSWRGRLSDLVFRASLLELEVTLRDGSKRSFRFVPSIARSGFLLSPAVDSADDFAALVGGHGGDPSSRSVRSFRVVAHGSAARDWAPTLAVHFVRFNVPDAERSAAVNAGEAADRRP